MSLQTKITEIRAAEARREASYNEGLVTMILF